MKGEGKKRDDRFSASARAAQRYKTCSVYRRQ